MSEELIMKYYQSRNYIPSGEFRSKILTPRVVEMIKGEDEDGKVARKIYKRILEEIPVDVDTPYEFVLPDVSAGVLDILITMILTDGFSLDEKKILEYSTAYSPRYVKVLIISSKN